MSLQSCIESLALSYNLPLPLSLDTVNGSYLDVPRIHFHGKYRADVNSRNNWNCNFDPSLPLYPKEEWNFNGTSEWELIDTVVTSVVDKDGNEVSNSPLLGAELFSNQERPLAKIVDLDADFQKCTVYGLNIGLRVGNETVFWGKWSPSVIVHELWNKSKCAKPKHHTGQFGTLSTSRITDIVWSSSSVIQELQEATRCQNCTGDLAVSITLDLYSEEIFTIGSILGTIGVAKSGEPLNAGGDRHLESTKPAITFPPDHPCKESEGNHQTDPWTNYAPFTIDKSRNVLVMDISNAFPTRGTNQSIDLGKLWLGVLRDNNRVSIFGESIPYLDPDLQNRGGIIEQNIDNDTLDASLLVIVKEILEGEVDGDNVYPLALKEAFPALKSTNNKVQLLLKESLYYIRPTGYYLDRLQYPMKNTSDMTLLVTKYGKPVEGATVKVDPVFPVLPRDGIAAVQDTKQTDSDGLVTFTFQVASQIPFPRRYIAPPSCTQESTTILSGKDVQNHIIPDIKLITEPDINEIFTLPIDGQVYSFYFCVGEAGNCKPPNLSQALLTFLAFSTTHYTRPYTWVDHVQPIFEQFHHLHYIMRTILDLSNFTEVTSSHNRELLRISFEKEITDPNYMPVTRDLSPTKRLMILEWLENPLYDATSSGPPGQPSDPICHTPPSTTLLKGATPPYHFWPLICQHNYIPFQVYQEEVDQYFTKVVCNEQPMNFSLAAEHPPRPLFGFESEQEKTEISNLLKTIPFVPVCSVENLREQLQLAIQLEFFTLPLYLTSLYTIMEDCNTDAYRVIRNIAMQEMLHFAQAANMLIAVGGNVKIDYPDIVPSYPTVGLPGGVRPNLMVSLKKFELSHVYSNFMGLETPALTYVDLHHPECTLNTIGQFYKEIELCMKTLGDSIYDPSSVDKQVEWPWNETKDIGKLYKVTNFTSAKKAIKEIVEQGEGANPLHPNDAITGQYAHFYRFEEIVCQRKLNVSESGYTYDGDPIPYNPQGVWPMRDNPSKEFIVPGTECHTQARAFHQVYRNFLRVMQKTFSGSPEKITEAVELMEALQVHAKKTMWTPYDKTRTCGPVWDYEWE